MIKDLLGIFSVLNVRKCVRSCDVGEYLDCKKCKRRNKLVDKLIEECSESFDGNKMIHSVSKCINFYQNVCNSCTV